MKSEPSEGSSFFRDCLVEWRVMPFSIILCFNRFVLGDLCCLIETEVKLFTFMASRCS